MAVTYAGVLTAIGSWWLSRRWYRLASEVEGLTDDGAGTDESGDSGAHEHDGEHDDEHDQRDGGQSDHGIFDALARLDHWRVIAAAAGIVGLLLALPARLVTVGGGWDALSDGDFLAMGTT
jgi:hypothetical protein